MNNREIDALVAENVFGWWWGDDRHYRDKQYNCTLYAPDDPRYLDEFVLAAPLSNPRYLDRIPAYSTDPTASKQLRGRANELGYYWRIERTPSGKVTIAIWKDGKVRTDRGTDESLTFAVCFLRALGVPVE